jgi:hypothetical protein
MCRAPMTSCDGMDDPVTRASKRDTGVTSMGRNLAKSSRLAQSCAGSRDHLDQSYLWIHLGAVMEDMKNKNRLEFRLDVVVLAKPGVYVAQCLQHDIVVQAPNVQTMKERFSHAFAARVAEDLAAGREPLSTVPQAPRRFWDMYLRGFVESRDVPVYVPSTRESRLEARATFSQVESTA